MAKDRSPKSPRNTLKSAVDAAGRLFTAAKRAPLTRDAAARAMGYSGMTGVSMTLLGSLSGYGLIQKRGTDIGVSDRAIAILHPTSPEQKKSALRDAALAPPLFHSLAEHHLGVSPSVLTSKLIQMGFSPDSAKKTASVFLENAQFAGLTSEDASVIGENEDDDDELEFEEQQAEESAPRPVPSRVGTVVRSYEPYPIQSNVLATYQVPLGSNHAEIRITGEKLEARHFAALAEFVKLFGLQFAGDVQKPAQIIHRYPAPIAGVWRNKDHDKPVRIVALMTCEGLPDHYQTEEGTGIPAAEVVFDAAPSSEGDEKGDGETQRRRGLLL